VLCASSCWSSRYSPSCLQTNRIDSSGNLQVAAFIFIELVTFPFGCGIVLDLSTIWLFPEANLQSRTGFFAQAPLTAVFYHWVAGTLFMCVYLLLVVETSSYSAAGTPSLSSYQVAGA
jgi:hypothetical protein